MIQAVLDHPRFDEFDLSSLRLVMSASAAIPVPVLRRAIDKIESGCVGVPWISRKPRST